MKKTILLMIVLIMSCGESESLYHDYDIYTIDYCITPKTLEAFLSIHPDNTIPSENCLVTDSLEKSCLCKNDMMLFRISLPFCVGRCCLRDTPPDELGNGRDSIYYENQDYECYIVIKNLDLDGLNL